MILLQNFVLIGQHPHEAIGIYNRILNDIGITERNIEGEIETSYHLLNNAGNALQKIQCRIFENLKEIS